MRRQEKVERPRSLKDEDQEHCGCGLRADGVGVLWRWGVTHFDTIVGGVGAVGAAGTAYVADGTYDENVGISGKSISLLGSGPNTRIEPSSGEHTIVIGGNEALPGTVVSGFTIVAAPDAEDKAGSRLNPWGTVADPIVITNNAFTGDINGELPD